MTIPTETALRGRARALLEAMTERARWIYAVPIEAAEAHVGPAMEAAKLRVEDEDRAAGVARYSNEARTASFVVFRNADLEVTLVEATGADAPPVLAALLDETGFYAQSQLLRTALDVRDPEAPKALRTLAHMVVAWDEDWSDLFLLHLASPDPIVRHDAVTAVTIAAMVARDRGPALRLLEEAERREKFPKLRETIAEARRVVEGMTGGPVTPEPDPPAA